MKAQWLISNLGDTNIHKLHYAAKEIGRESEIITLGDIAQISETDSNERKCVISCGSIWGNREIRRSRPNWIGTFHERKFFSCTNYYSYLGKMISQKNYCMLTLEEMFRRKDWMYEKFGKDDLIFLRPNSGEKEFNGELVHKVKFDEWQNYIQQALTLDPTLLCVVSEPIEIQSEMRILVAEGKAVTGSYYRVAKHLHSEEVVGEDWDKCAKFAESVVASLPNAPPFFVVDIAVESDRISVLEIGCFCCAGMYACDRHKIAEAVSIAAENEFSRKEKENDIKTEEHRQETP